MIRYLSLTQSDEAFAADIARHSGDENRVYKEENGLKLHISLYYPPAYDVNIKHPLFVLIHGGGWQGRKVFDDQAEWAGDYLGFLARHYADRGFLCASIDYRLMKSPGKGPGCALIDLYEDCAAAVDYLKNRADDLGIDLAKTVLLGESAGGYLAAALVTLPLGDTSFFQTAILVNAITDLSDPCWGKRLNVMSSHPALQGKSMVDKIDILSPVMHISAKTCPTLLIHGEQDTCVSPFHSARFHDRLQFYGVRTQLDYIADTGHAFLLAEYMQEKQKPLSAAVLGVQSIDQWLADMLA